MERRDTPKGAHLFEWGGVLPSSFRTLELAGPSVGKRRLRGLTRSPAGRTGDGAPGGRQARWRPGAPGGPRSAHSPEDLTPQPSRCGFRWASAWGRTARLQPHPVGRAAGGNAPPPPPPAPPRPAPPPGAAEGSSVVIRHHWEASGPGGRGVRVTGLLLPILCELLITAQP